MAGAQIIEGTTNIPTRRYMFKRRNLQEALDERNQYWQRISNIGGFSPWDLGEKDEEMDLLKDEIKLKKKYPDKTKSEIQEIELSKEIYKLDKYELTVKLRQLGLPDSEIKKLKYEKDRVNKIIELRSKKSKKTSVYFD